MVEQRQVKPRALLWTLGLCVSAWPGDAQAGPPAPDDPSTVDAVLSQADFEGGPSDQALEAAPLRLGESVVGASWHPDYGGTVYGRKSLYVYSLAGEWRTRPWEQSVEPLHLFRLAGEESFVGDPGALFHRADAMHFERKVVSGIDPRTRELAWRRAWVEPSQARIWILAGADRLLRVDRESGAATVFHIPLPPAGAPGEAHMVGRVDASTGAPQVVFSLGASVFSWRDGEVHSLGRLETAPTALELSGDAEGSAMYRDKAPVTFSLVPAVEGSNDAALTPEAQRIYDAVSLSERMAERTKTLPGAETFWFPSLRFQNAAEFRFREPVAAYGLELGVGVMLSPPSGKGAQRRHANHAVEAWFWPELGYSWSSDERSLGHAAFVGLGFGAGNDFVAGYYKPRALVGAFDRGVAPGLRHGLGVQAFWGALGLELSHGMAFARSGDDSDLDPEPRPKRVAHDLRLGLDINLVPIVWALHLWFRR